MSEQIRKAVETIKKELNILPKYSAWDEYRHSLSIVIDLATSYLNATEPREKEMLPMVTDYRFGKSTQHGIWCYNEGLKDSRLYHIKQMEGLEALFRKHANYFVEEAYIYSLAHAIRVHLGLEKEKR